MTTHGIITAPILGLDTSTPTARIAVVDAAGVVLASGARTATRHSSHLLPTVDEVLTASGVPLRALAAIVCGAGPGSFTGLRVGLAMAKGLALPTGIPLVLVSSLQALACDLSERVPTAASCLALLDAGKDQVYAQLFLPGAEPRPLFDPWTIAPADLALHLGVLPPGVLAVGGGGLDRYEAVSRQVFPDADLQIGLSGPSATAVAGLGRRRLARGEQDSLESSVPVYGRPPDITRPKPR